MTNSLATTNTLVKADADECVRRFYVVEDPELEEAHRQLCARLQRILDVTGKSMTSLSLEAGASKGFIDSILKHRSKNPSVHKLNQIAIKAGFNPSWLTQGTLPERPGDPMPRPEAFTVGNRESWSEAMRVVFDKFDVLGVFPTSDLEAVIAKYGATHIDADEAWWMSTFQREIRVFTTRDDAAPVSVPAVASKPEVARRIRTKLVRDEE
jgi:hypothetical protein